VLSGTLNQTFLPDVLCGCGGSQRRRTVEAMLIYLDRLGLRKGVDELQVLHVTGTKGKGSTCAFVESILRAQGYRTGGFAIDAQIKLKMLCLIMLP